MSQITELFSSWTVRVISGIGMLALAITAVVLTTGRGFEEELGDDLTHTIQRGDLVVSVTEQGTLESANNTQIKNKVRGFSVVTDVIEVGTIVQDGSKSWFWENTVLVRLDTKAIENQLSTAKTNVNSAMADLARSQANVEANEIAIKAYKEGRFVSQLNEMKRAHTIATSRLEEARKTLEGTKKLYQMTFANRQELDASEFAVTQFELELAVQENAMKVLKEYSFEMQDKTLQGNWKASKTKLESDKEALKEEEKRRDRLQQELDDCVIKAPRDGLVIYPSAAAWKRTPDIEKGASVRMDQVLLLMPDLDRMQIKVGVHESIVDQLRLGMKAEISLSENEEPFIAEVSKIANVTKPAGWWTGNVVKYDTIIKLPPGTDLKPGMTAKVKIILATHYNVPKIPVAAVVMLDGESYCWVSSPAGVKKRKIELGDSNDIFVVVESGLEEGEEVVLNPLARVEEAQSDAQRVIERSRSFKAR